MQRLNNRSGHFRPKLLMNKSVISDIVRSGGKSHESKANQGLDQIEQEWNVVHADGNDQMG